MVPFVDDGAGYVGDGSECYNFYGEIEESICASTECE